MKTAAIALCSALLLTACAASTGTAQTVPSTTHQRLAETQQRYGEAVQAAENRAAREGLDERGAQRLGFLKQQVSMAFRLVDHGIQEGKNDLAVFWLDNADRLIAAIDR